MYSQKEGMLRSEWTDPFLLNTTCLPESNGMPELEDAFRIRI